MKEKILNIGSEIKYIAIDPTPGGSNLGRAEFEFCPVFKRGKMIDLWIYRRQQRNREVYRLDLREKGIVSFSFSKTHGQHGIDLNIWRNCWCKEHKTICFVVYVPDDTDTIRFEYHFGNDLTIKFAQG